MTFDILYVKEGSRVVLHQQVFADDRAGAIGLAYSEIPSYSTLISVTEHSEDI